MLQEGRDATIAAVADSMARLLQQVDALTASLSDTARDAAVTILASNMHAMNLALGDAAEVRGLAVDLAAVLAGDVTGDAYLRAAAELTCMQERRVDTQVCALPALMSVVSATLQCAASRPGEAPPQTR